MSSKWVTAKQVKDGLNAGSRLLLISKSADSILNQDLTQQGYTVVIVTRAFEALQMMQARTFDMVVVDLSDDSTGSGDEESFATSEMIRILEDPQQSKTPIIALTSGDVLEIKERALKAGMTQVVAKTENLDTLQETLKNLSNQLR